MHVRTTCTSRRLATCFIIRSHHQPSASLACFINQASADVHVDGTKCLAEKTASRPSSSPRRPASRMDWRYQAVGVIVTVLLFVLLSRAELEDLAQRAPRLAGPRTGGATAHRPCRTPRQLRLFEDGRPPRARRRRGGHMDGQGSRCDVGRQSLERLRGSRVCFAALRLHCRDFIVCTCVE